MQDVEAAHAKGFCVRGSKASIKGRSVEVFTSPSPANRRGSRSWTQHVSSIRLRVAFLHNNVALENFVTVNALEPPDEIGALPCLGRLWCWRRREQRDDSATFADTNRFARFNPIEDASEVVPQLSNGSCFHA